MPQRGEPDANGRFQPIRPPAGEVVKVGVWVEPGGSIVVSRTTGIGASRPLPRVAAIVSFLNPQPARGNRSSCPTADLRPDGFERLSRVELGCGAVVLGRPCLFPPLSDRLQHQHRCCHADPIPHGRDAQRPEFAVGLRYEHASDRLRSVCLLPGHVRDFVDGPRPRVVAASRSPPPALTGALPRATFHLALGPDAGMSHVAGHWRKLTHSAELMVDPDCGARWAIRDTGAPRARPLPLDRYCVWRD